MEKLGTHTFGAAGRLNLDCIWRGGETKGARKHVSRRFRDVRPFSVADALPPRKRARKPRRRGRCGVDQSATPLGLTAMRPVTRAAGPAPQPQSGPELPQPFKSAALAAAVACREQASNAVTVASANAASPDAAADAEARTCSPTLAPPVPRSAGPRKQQTSSLYSNAGRSYPSPPFSLRTGLVARSSPPWSDRDSAVPLFGYLRADAQDSCYGVVTVRSSDTEATFRESLYWPEGEILRVRRLGTSNKVKPRSYDDLLIPVQPYKKSCTSLRSVRFRWASDRRLPRPQTRPLRHLRKSGAAHGWRSRPSRVYAQVRSMCRTSRHRGPVL
ncbi:hypothetical protein HPB49_014524 [Dermacentor silvarum]|uniref:Uncharacterized protein n=1 Tax=Dermacentor silvarum TaxID=543639 RepID=A0ACB8C9U0_DERSI|nr:hypothetical protein HPB49_014524 [Dermacentor silvarum]